MCLIIIYNIKRTSQLLLCITSTCLASKIVAASKAAKHGITQRRKKKLQPEDRYSCWGIRWSIFVDELRSAAFLSISMLFSCLMCCCQVQLKQLSYGFCEHVYRPACRDQDAIYPSGHKALQTSDTGVDATPVVTIKASLL